MDHHHDDEVVPDSEDELLNDVVPDSEDELLYEVVPWSPKDETTANKPCPHTKRSLFRRAASETVVHSLNNQDQGGDGLASTKREKKAIDWPSKKADITLLESLKKSDDRYDMTSLYEDVKAARLDIPESLQEYQVRRRVEKLMNNYFRSFKKEKHNIDCSSSCSHNCSHNDDATNIDKLSEEIWGEEVRNTRVHMNAQEYLDRYPRIHTSMYKLSAYSHHFKESGYDHIIDCMGFLSPKELNEMETEWADYYKGEATQELKEDVLMAAKMSDLLEKAKQLAHNNNKHK